MPLLLVPSNAKDGVPSISAYTIEMKNWESMLMGANATTETCDFRRKVGQFPQQSIPRALMARATPLLGARKTILIVTQKCKVQSTERGGAPPWRVALLRLDPAVLEK
jgi:hypothetical protein